MLFFVGKNTGIRRVSKWGSYLKSTKKSNNVQGDANKGNFSERPATLRSASLNLVTTNSTEYITQLFVGKLGVTLGVA